MFLDNWYTALGHLLTGTQNKSYKTLSGSTAHSASPSTMINLSNKFTAVGSSTETAYNIPKVIFGDGDTPVKVSDYALSGEILGVTGTGNLATTVEEDGSLKTTGIYVLTNNTGVDVTIKEMGIIVGVRSGYTVTCLIERTVLDTPVTIPNGSIGQVTYTIRTNFPIA